MESSSGRSDRDQPAGRAHRQTDSQRQAGKQTRYTGRQTQTDGRTDDTGTGTGTGTRTGRQAGRPDQTRQDQTGGNLVSSRCSAGSWPSGVILTGQRQLLAATLISFYRCFYIHQMLYFIDSNSSYLGTLAATFHLSCAGAFYLLSSATVYLSVYCV